MKQEEIQNLKVKLGLNHKDEDLSGAGVKLKRVFESLEQAQAEIERLNNHIDSHLQPKYETERNLNTELLLINKLYRQELMVIGAKCEPPASKIANDVLWIVENRQFDK